MHQVVSPISIIQKILGEQRTDTDVFYRLSTYCMRINLPEGVLLYHTLTGELILLSHEETALMEELPGSVPKLLEELVLHRFLVPEQTDDMALADQVHEIADRFGKKSTDLTGYTIFTTTDCNARCFYCYEIGWNKSSMTEQTAFDTAKFIATNCNGKSVSLRWFGGEPLVNTRAIEIIVDYLRQNEVKFRSSMTSNGYLFDEALVRRARDVWNLERVQITLDGTEKVYNNRKAYVNPDGSPYKRVLRNIDLLLDAGISVRVRLNMDNNNEKDLYALINDLADRFSGRLGFDIFSTVIYENKGLNSRSYTEDERYAYVEKIRSIRTYIEEKGMAFREKLKRGYAVHVCPADSSTSTTVTPNGLLGRCASCKNGDIWGSIYSKEVDSDVLMQWRERKASEEACKSCMIYPQCARLKKCPDWIEYCSPIERFLREDRLRRAVLTAYEDWKSAGQN